MRATLLWKGPGKSIPIRGSAGVRPNSLYVVPAPAVGDAQAEAVCRLLGDIPPESKSWDVGDEGFVRSRDRALFRLAGIEVRSAELELDAPTVQQLFDDGDEFEPVALALVRKFGGENEEWQQLAIDSLLGPNFQSDSPDRLAKRLKSRADLTLLDSGRIAVVGRRRIGQYSPEILTDDNSSRAPKRRVSLEEHSAGVAAFARRYASGCGLDSDLYGKAGVLHDVGKLDPRFQAMLYGVGPDTARSLPALAKSGQGRQSRDEIEVARQRHGYPAGARHELLSAHMLRGTAADELFLYLVATHHGAARPFAEPLGEQDDAEGYFEGELFGQRFAATPFRQDTAAWNAWLPDLFWRVVRQYGWWGSAFAEATFRLADHAQSRTEQEKEREAVARPNFQPLAIDRIRSAFCTDRSNRSEWPQPARLLGRAGAFADTHGLGKFSEPARLVTRRSKAVLGGNYSTPSLLR